VSDKPWKQAERRVAEMFGCLRQVLSGSSGRPDKSASDSTHETLFIECKYRESHTTRTLWEGTRALARKERKTPVVALVDKGKPGALLCIHGDDFPAVIAEYMAALEPDDADALEGMIRRAYLRIRGEEIEEEAA
jgi:hypothetical protein